MSSLQYSIESWVGSTRVIVSGEISDLGGIISKARELEAARQGSTQYKEGVAVEGAVVAQAAQTEPSGPVSLLGLKIVSDPAVPEDTIVAVYPSIDDVADVVKALVARQGLPKTAQMLQDFGASRAKDVAPEQRAGFIAKGKEVLA